MSVHEARDIVDAEFLPPARQSDLVSAVQTFRPDVIGLVDGEFSQSLSVWHKEILFAIERGVRVYGAASMGALRACEADRFGMIGVGRIYSMYRDGALEDDDEVALQYASAAEDFRNLSMPLVNIRATLDRARAERRIDRSEHDTFIRAAKSLFFRNRHTSELRKRASEAGLSESSVSRICKELDHNYLDQKREDARELMRTLRDLTWTGPDDTPAWRLNSSPQFMKLRQQDLKVQHLDVDVPLGQIANYFALHSSDFDVTNFNARNRALVGLLAEILMVDVNAAEIDSEVCRFKSRLELGDSDVFELWLKANDLQHESFHALMKNMATCRKLHRWSNLREPDSERITVLLDEIRLQGKYSAIAARAASHNDLVSAEVPDTSDVDVEKELVDLIAAQLEHSDWTLHTDCESWSEEAGFSNLADLRRELMRNKRARRKVARIAKKVATDMSSDTLE